MTPTPHLGSTITDAPTLDGLPEDAVVCSASGSPYTKAGPHGDEWRGGGALLSSALLVEPAMVPLPLTLIHLPGRPPIDPTHLLDAMREQVSESDRLTDSPGFSRSAYQARGDAFQTVIDWVEDEYLAEVTP